MHLLHIAYAHLKAHFIAHFRFFGNRFRILGNRNSPFDRLLQTFAVGNNSVSHNN